MVSPDRSALPSLALLVLAVAVVIAGWQVVPYPGVPEYYHSVESVDRAEIPSEAHILHSDDLSPDARRAFLACLESEDGNAVFYGPQRWDPPPEFFYSDSQNLGRGIYYVEHEDTYYRLDTYAGGAFPILEVALFAGFMLVAGVLTVVGVRGLRRDRHRLSTVVLVGALVAWATFVVDLYDPTHAPQEYLVTLGLFFVVVTAGSTWLLLGPRA